ncbi:MAG: PKD domain-containing protein, partial [Bacteroidota bacterium]
MKKITLQIAIAAFLFLIGNLTSVAQLSFTASPTSGCAPLNVTFTNTSTNPSIHYIKWSFQDGSPSIYDTVPLSPVSHTYTTSSFYNPSMEAYSITNAYLGYTSGTGGGIQVNGAGFNSPDSACANDMVNFCMNDQGANSYSWNFGDGGTSTN